MIERPQETSIGPTASLEAEQVITVVIGMRTYIVKPLALYEVVKPMITLLLTGSTGTAESAEQKNVAMLFKAGVKGVFVAGGPMLLKMLYGTHDHPKPGKKDDVLAWYADILTVFAIKQITNRTILVDAVESENEANVYELVGYTPKSL